MLGDDFECDHNLCDTKPEFNTRCLVARDDGSTYFVSRHWCEAHVGAAFERSVDTTTPRCVLIVVEDLRE